MTRFQLILLVVVLLLLVCPYGIRSFVLSPTATHHGHDDVMVSSLPFFGGTYSWSPRTVTTTTTLPTGTNAPKSSALLAVGVVQDHVDNVDDFMDDDEEDNTDTSRKKNDFTNILADYVARNDTSSIPVEGYVIAKRSLGKQLIFVDFQTTTGDLCQAMLRDDSFFVGQGGEKEYDYKDGFKRCLVKGTKLKVTGIAIPTRNPGNNVLLLQSMQLTGLPRQLQHIQIILRLGLVERTIPMEQLTLAAGWDQPPLLSPSLTGTGSGNEEYVEEGEVKDKNTKQWLKQLAKDVFESLPEDPMYPAAANQQEISRRGNFVIPAAPREWQEVPKELMLAALEDNGPTQPMQPMESIHRALEQDATGLDLSPLISATGWVRNRRRFEGNISRVSLVDNMTQLLSPQQGQGNNSKDDAVAKDRISCLINPRLLSRMDNDNAEETAELFQTLLAVGAKVWVGGRFRHDTVTNKRVLWVNDIRLVQSSSRSVTIRYLLDLMHARKIDLEQGAEALLLPLQEAQSILSMDATGRRWRANQLAVTLQQAQKNSAGGDRFQPELVQVMTKYQHLVDRHPVIPTEIVVSSLVDQLPSLKLTTSEGSSSFFPPTARRPIMPVGMPGSKWESKKRPQLEWMGQQIGSVLESHPDYGKRKLSILDIGGGKGSLAHYLGQSLQDQVQIHVVDICAGAIANGASKAQRLQLPVEFQWADATSTDVLTDIPADVVVALHACGHLSDVALAHAIHRRAGFVLVPCCFNSNPHLTIPQVNSVEDDSSFETTKVTDWLGIPPDDWSTLKLLAEVQGDITLASRAIGTICAIRAETAQQRLRGEDISIDIRSFPIQYSTRNTVLVGKFGGKKQL
jgi:hypothetical protein